jgi:pimeloyl-ACP methyl ester carboxylesterase
MLPQLDAFAAAVIKEQAALGTVVLAGNSLGGTTSLRAAQKPNLPVAGVVSIAAPGFVDSWLIRTVARYPIPLRLYSALPLPVPGFVVRTVAEQLVPRFLYANAAKAEASHVKRFLDLFPDYRATTMVLEQARQLVEELANAYQLETVKVPLLVVACGKDKLVSAASGRQLHALVPHSRLMVREDWGHCPQLDDPIEIAELLTYFAAGVSRTDKAKRPLAPSAKATSQHDSAAG